MDRVEIPDDQVIPLDAVTDGVEGLRLGFVNVFSIRHDQSRWTLIDAGIPYTAGRIRRWAEQHHSGPPQMILLTHGHFDHVGAAAELAEEWNVPVLAHQDEFPYLTGDREYPPPNAGAGGGLMSLLSPLYPRSPIDLRPHLKALPASPRFLEDAPLMPGWQVLQTPGHTPGHVSLFRDSDRTLLPGDAFCTTKPESFFEAALFQDPELHGPPAYFTMDWEQAHESVQQLAQLNPLVVAPGHGKPLYGPAVPEALRTLAEHFEQVAVPNNRK